MTEGQFKRNTAYKYRIGDILLGKPIFDNDKFLFIELRERKISRVNVIGNIVDKYESEGDKKYAFFTLDDGSGQIKLKVFGDDTEKFKNTQQGQTVTIIGTVRNWNNETYVQPEGISEMDAKYLLVRKLEMEKIRKETSRPIETREEAVAVKDQILGAIKGSEDDGGIDTDQIIMKFRELSTDVINEEIKKLLEEGTIFEPRPGRLRYLG
ncbi:MAG: OB-fold nucleic acid binding domain-containing protein [Nanoarchaeota archaeon]|jgi:RPA family protein|nr:OB-fold nucleic acid binding domain-containing protein [Nanoarchaeota archaeon]